MKSIPPLPDGLPDDATYRTANRLHSLAIRLLRRARMADRETGLSPVRLSLLSVLVFGGPRTLGQLAMAEGVSRPAITRVAKSLERDRLIERLPRGQDRRVVRVRATAAGRRLMERGRRGRVEQIALELAGLDSAELDQLSRATEILQKLPRPPSKDQSD